ncbi:glycoside hydrolase family 89 protein [Pseudocercospora fijiensis CIRAD86]|uniref:Glycoside hydrolase family 89 protein n=1 Tax=Pseudocercospora fijiensis (strain CIRAD86) TaxID=383855 RepID=N1QB09_PSEFD|nr:glycoside hydrolase family 89 protein [Pseudocercospora fijiensis CIRAD86]EME88218.1 glycoside hydrolase family 89 protein [Pseudocercospora fijiensis CIRAD86]
MLAVLVTLITAAAAISNHATAGIEALVKRRLPRHVDGFSFSIDPSYPSASSSTPPNDRYTVANGDNGTICISGNSPIALASALRWYLVNAMHVDLYWFVGSNFDLAPEALPPLKSTYHGSSIVPYRYHFNTVTFSYTAAFWSWEEWEQQLDWMALRGINLPLAWVGFEKLLQDVFLGAGFTNAEIGTFLSGPAFQAWNRFGNIQGSWGGDLPQSWIDHQFELNKKIVARMVELGMTPVLPCFTGFVPTQISRLYPNASFVNGSRWNGFQAEYTNVTFLEPFDPLFTTLQKSFISKQIEAYGNVSSIYTLDQYNENDPFSGELAYLKNVTSNTIKSLKAADPEAIWFIQGWLFYSSADFWTDERVEAYLGGVANEDMLILDLFSESQPQWQRTNSYFGKPWIWCQLHDYGGNQGLHGQVENVTINPVQALANKTSTMVGMGSTMEGQEGNEIIYDILLDQAWSKEPIDSDSYFHDWVTSRYAGSKLPSGLYTAWDVMRQTVYNSTDIEAAEAVTKSIFELEPNTTGLLNRRGHHSTLILYDPNVLVSAWNDLYNASNDDIQLWDVKAYQFDLVDTTRQVLANAFYPLYTDFVHSANKSVQGTYSPTKAEEKGKEMIMLLKDLDSVLEASGNAHFKLSSWIESARLWAPAEDYADDKNTTAKIADFYEYTARNQITLWGPNGEISDYASKQWAGLIRSYYVPRWQRFVDFTLNSTTSMNGENGALKASLTAFELAWQLETSTAPHASTYSQSDGGNLKDTIARVVTAWPNVFKP